MKKSEAISKKIVNRITPESSLPERSKKISYSQYSIFKECNYRWYLTYGKKIFPFTSSIDTVFGTALHETIQQYLQLLFNSSIKEATSFNYASFLKTAMMNAYLIEKEKNENKHFVSSELMEEYYNDGLEMMSYIKKNRKSLFDVNNYELVGIEIPLMTKVSNDLEFIWFNGFLDIILYDKIYNKYIIIDIKTSKNGWKDYDKKNEKKIAQLLLYKKFFSIQFEIPQDQIEIKFLIIKRKKWEDSPYPIKRTQEFIPANGESKIKQAYKNMIEFVHECFEYNGDIIEKEYLKTPGKNFSNCRFCPFAGSELCDQKES